MANTKKPAIRKVRKPEVEAKPGMIVLWGWNPWAKFDQELEQLFTLNEKATAVEIAKIWHGKGFEPVLVSKTWDGDFEFLYNWKTPLPVKKTPRKKPAAKKAA